MRAGGWGLLPRPAPPRVRPGFGSGRLCVVDRVSFLFDDHPLCLTASSTPLEEVSRLFEHDRVEDVEFLFDVPFLRFGGKEAVAFFFEAGGVDDHVPPGGAPVEVLSQPADDGQCGRDDRGRH